jgi:hypothetical protein
MDRKLAQSDSDGPDRSSKYAIAAIWIITLAMCAVLIAATFYK